MDGFTNIINIRYNAYKIHDSKFVFLTENLQIDRPI